MMPEHADTLRIDHLAAMAEKPLPENECGRIIREIRISFVDSDRDYSIGRWRVQYDGETHAGKTLRSAMDRAIGAFACREHGAGRRAAPWTDFCGNMIYEGDVVEHPSGEFGTVAYLDEGETPADRWIVRYRLHNNRLCLQIGDKGRAVVVKGGGE